MFRFPLDFNGDHAADPSDSNPFLPHDLREKYKSSTLLIGFIRVWFWEIKVDDAFRASFADRGKRKKPHVIPIRTIC